MTVEMPPVSLKMVMLKCYFFSLDFQSVFCYPDTPSQISEKLQPLHPKSLKHNTMKWLCEYCPVADTDCGLWKRLTERTGVLVSVLACSPEERTFVKDQEGNVETFPSVFSKLPGWPAMDKRTCARGEVGMDCIW